VRGAAIRFAVKTALAEAALGDIDQQAALADLDQDISASPTEAEVQAISDKVDALLAALRAAGVLAEA
jgi:acetolactate synthase small subunit